MLIIADVCPEASFATAFIITCQHSDGRVIRPHHGRLKYSFSLQIIKPLQEFGGRCNPVTLSAAGNMQTVSHKDVFLSIQRQMIAELTDNDLSDQTRSGNATDNGSFRRRRTRDSVFAVTTGILRTNVFVNFQL